MVDKMFLLEIENPLGRALNFERIGVFETLEKAKEFGESLAKGKEFFKEHFENYVYWYVVYETSINGFFQCTRKDCVFKTFEWEDYVNRREVFNLKVIDQKNN